MPRGLAASFVVRAGTAGQLHQRGRLVEAMRLRSAVLLLFEDPTEASEFEKAVTAARVAAHRAKGKTLEPAWRRRHPAPGGSTKPAARPRVIAAPLARRQRDQHVGQRHVAEPGRQCLRPMGPRTATPLTRDPA